MIKKTTDIVIKKCWVSLATIFFIVPNQAETFFLHFFVSAAIKSSLNTESGFPEMVQISTPNPKALNTRIPAHYVRGEEIFL
jgi:hypothetical protein